MGFLSENKRLEKLATMYDGPKAVCVDCGAVAWRRNDITHELHCENVPRKEEKMKAPPVPPPISERDFMRKYPEAFHTFTRADFPNLRNLKRAMAVEDANNVTVDVARAAMIGPSHAKDLIVRLGRFLHLRYERCLGCDRIDYGSWASTGPDTSDLTLRLECLTHQCEYDSYFIIPDREIITTPTPIWHLLGRWIHVLFQIK